VLLAASMLASVGGLYQWTTLPCLALTAVLFMVSGARIGADPALRILDGLVIAGLAYVALQLLPLPSAALQMISPATSKLQDTYALAAFTGWRPLTVDPPATRAAFSTALTGALLFWTAREAFSHGGTRAAMRLLGWIGFGCALLSLAQHATAPTTVFWKWRVDDPRALPFGPFVDRNQLATWLVLTIAVVTGYLAMRVRAHMDERVRDGWHAGLVALSDGGSLAMAGCLSAMLVTLATTLSRSGLLALVAAAVIGVSIASGSRSRGLKVGTIAALALFLLAAWLNVQGLADRVVATLTSADPRNVGRLVIWRDTMRIVHDFPWFGTGAGTFEDAMFVYQRTAREVLFNHAHNEYLQLLTEGGVPLVLVIVGAVGTLARTARVRLAGDEGSQRFVRIGACAALAGIALQSVWETGLRAPANLMLAAIIAALAVRPVTGERGAVTTESVA
jgi:O-antigen ligase